MQLALPTSAALAANTKVSAMLRDAHAASSRALALVETGTPLNPSVKADVASALASAQEAKAGVAKLGARGVLGDTFQRFSHHSSTALADAVAILQGSRPIEGHRLESLTAKLSDAESSARLGTAAGDRSLARASDPERLGDLDEIGNVRRGGNDSWAGPDGQRYDSMGSPVSSGGSYGPDGESFSGI